MLTNRFPHVCTIYTGALGQAEKHVLIYLGSELISRDGNCVMKKHNSGWPSVILLLICLEKKYHLHGCSFDRDHLQGISVFQKLFSVLMRKKI